jgi:hypothetical protein
VSEQVDPRLELAVCLGIIALCAAVLVEAASIRPGFFEPLGSGPVPRTTAWSIIVLAAVTAGRAVLRWRAGAVPVVELRERWLDMAAVFALTLGYVAVLHLRLTTFDLMTTAYLGLAIGILVRFERRKLPWVVLVAAAVGFGSQYVFTRIFVVDLPGL